MADSQNQAMMRKARPKGRALLAFTMVEVVMVLAIMVIVAAIAVPRYAEAENRYRLEGAARRIARDVDMAKVACRADGQTRTFVVDSVAPGYQVTASSGGRLAGTSSYAVSLVDSPYRVKVDVSGGNKTLSFAVDGHGEIQGTGDITITCGQQYIVLTLGSVITTSSISDRASGVASPQALDISGTPVGADAGADR